MWKIEVVWPCGAKECEDCVSACRFLKVEGKRSVGGQRKTWNKCVVDDLKELGLDKDLCKDRERWRCAISGKNV